jgi:hypothetical protein
MGIGRMTKSIDIEKLVQWALLGELPKGRPVSAEIGYAIGRRHRRRPFALALAGALPDIDALGFVPGAPHEDAVVVADAIAALPRDVPIASIDDARNLLGEFAAIGEVAAQSLLKATFDPQSLVISFAIRGGRPPWRFEMSVPRETRYEFRDAVGSLRTRSYVEGYDDAGDLVLLHPNRGRAAMTRGLYDFARAPRCPLQWCDPSPLAVGHARAEYFAWHFGLCQLARVLERRLKAFEPLPPAARPLPWITGEEPKSRVLADGKRTMAMGFSESRAA